MKQQEILLTKNKNPEIRKAQGKKVYQQYVNPENPPSTNNGSGQIYDNQGDLLTFEQEQLKNKKQLPVADIPKEQHMKEIVEQTHNTTKQLTTGEISNISIILSYIKKQRYPQTQIQSVENLLQVLESGRTIPNSDVIELRNMINDLESSGILQKYTASMVKSDPRRE